MLWHAHTENIVHGHRIIAKAAHMCFVYLDMHMLPWSGLLQGCSWAGGALLLGCHVLVHAKPSICIACCAEDL